MVEAFYQLPPVIRDHYSVLERRSIVRISIPMRKAGQGSRVIVTLENGRKDVWDFVGMSGWKLVREY